MFVLAEGPCVSNMTVFGNERGNTPHATGNANGTVSSSHSSGHNLPPRSADSTTTMPSYGSCWDGYITNPSNPQRRDVQMLLPGHYIVIQWNQDNPGVWPFHCHIAWHLGAGFVWTVIEQPERIQEYMPIPYIMAQTCRDWWAWTGENVVPQIDDGL